MILLLEAEEVWTLLEGTGGLLDVGDRWLMAKDVLVGVALLGTKEVLVGAEEMLLCIKGVLLGIKDVLLGTKGVLLGIKDVLLGIKDVLLGVLLGIKGVLLDIKGVLLGIEGVLLDIKGVLLGIKGVLLVAEGRLLAEVIGAKRVLRTVGGASEARTVGGASEALLAAECTLLVSDENVLLGAALDNTFEEVLKAEGLLLEGKDALPGTEALLIGILILVLLGLPWRAEGGTAC